VATLRLLIPKTNQPRVEKVRSFSLIFWVDALTLTKTSVIGKFPRSFYGNIKVFAILGNFYFISRNRAFAKFAKRILGAKLNDRFGTNQGFSANVQEIMSECEKRLTT